MTKITAVVILYYPSSDVINNIHSYIKDIKILYVVCNSFIENSIYSKLLKIKNIKIIHKNSNIGIAKAINLALKNSFKENNKWLMTLDQDSSFNTNDFKTFINSFYKIKNKKNLAIFTPIHNKKFIKNSIEEKIFVMTSANIVNVDIALKIGGYDENIFIDEVDHEFCLKIKKKNFIIIQNNAIAINHILGTKIKKNQKKIVLYHSIRLYYMSRNYLYIKNIYKDTYPSFFKQRNKYLFIFFLKQIYYGKNKMKNIEMILKGIVDYKNKIYGKINE